jgi:sugar phosphate permease
MSVAQPPQDHGVERPRVTAYAWYALFVLVLVYIVNFIDRQILSILVGDIKRDLGVSDAQIGFLYGTAFAVFYALFGIPLGRLADSWYRGRLMAMGLTLWSSMTALSGFASSFGCSRSPASASASAKRARLPPLTP